MRGPFGVHSIAILGGGKAGGMKTLRVILVVLVCAAAVFETSCGGSGSGVTQPPPPTLSSISVTSSASSVTVGQTDQMTAIGTYSDSSTQNLTNSATWGSSNAGVATISASGLATGVAAGTVTFTATSRTIAGTSSTVTVTTPPPTLSSIAVTAATSSVVVGQTDQMTATATYSDGSTKNLTNSVTWSSSSTSVATISASGVATGVTAGTVTFTATSGSITGTSPTVTVTTPTTVTSVTVSCTPTTIQSGATSQCTATPAGTGNFSPAVSWKSSSTTAATVVSTGEDTAEVTGLTITSTTQVTITATSSQDASKSGAATITVLRTITIAISPPGFPWNQVYSRYGFILGWTLACSGCQVGDALYALGTVGQEGIVTTLTQPTTTLSMLTNVDANFNVPGPLKFWFLGSDGVQSNVLRLLYRGSQNTAVQSTATGEIYYLYSGDGSASAQGCSWSELLLFKPDGEADGSITCIPSANSFTIDDADHYLILIGEVIADKSGVVFYDLNNLNEVDGTPMPVNDIALSDTSTQIFAVATSGGNSCVVAPEAGTLFCVKDSQATQKPQPPIITVSGLNDPLALAMPDPNHVIAYCTGDQVLRWYTLDFVGGTATPSGTLALQDFTATTADFWNNYIATGGWFIVQVGSTLGVMGQVVNTDGTVSQELALINNTTQAQIGGNYKLPGGTVLIAPDAANGAIVAEYSDLTGDTPITRFARLYVDTGNLVDLSSTSTLAPSVAFLVLQNGEILTGVGGQIALQPNE